MYRLFGYNELYKDFDITTDSFVKAVKFIRNNPLSVIFVHGFYSKRVLMKLNVF